MNGKKEIVRLREKILANGTKSLYLDIYLNGRRKYEFLKLYLLPETTKENKIQNKTTMQLAEAVKAQRIIDVQNNRFGFFSNKLDGDFIEFVKARTDGSKMKQKTKVTYRMLSNRLDDYFDEKLTFRELGDKRTMQDFYDYLLDSYQKTSSANAVMQKLRKFANMAVREGIIQETNAIQSVELQRSESSERQYLTIDEITRLAKVMKEGDKYRINKLAFIFSCLTGLRCSDIGLISKDMISESGGRKRITFKQKKTGGLQYLDINRQAAEILETAFNETGKDMPFHTIENNPHAGDFLEKWVKDNGINKKITFHCARHSFAVMMLELGVDLYTVSKLLGHESIKTTQIYARIVDRRKREAVDLIPDVF